MTGLAWSIIGSLISNDSRSKSKNLLLGNLFKSSIFSKQNKTFKDVNVSRKTWEELGVYFSDPL